MKTVKINKAQALALVTLVYGERICGYDLDAVMRDRGTVCLNTGAKLYARKQGCVTRYHVSGYASDGSDVTRAMESIRAVAVDG